ncbi:hypothetical protein HOY80DRAFT_1135843 [Tuber brumale]|nr:hypothetical protein HOY80DRAFT_1135843 [Tuber brumale]
MPPKSFEENPSDSTEPRPQDPGQVPGAPEPETSESGVQDALQRLLDMTLGPNLGVETKFEKNVGRGGGDGDKGGGSDDDSEDQQVSNLLESSLVLNYMLSGPTSPTHEISIETISNDLGIERSAIVKALEDFLEADVALDDIASFEDPQKAVDRIRALASEAEVISWDSTPPEGSQEDGVPRLSTDLILELTLGDPWEWMGPLKEQTFHISERIQFLWKNVEELLALCQRVSHFSGKFAKRDELRYNLIKLGLKQLENREVNRSRAKIKCFDILNLACALIEAFMEKISEECEKGDSGGSEEGEGSEGNEESGEAEESRDATSSQAEPRERTSEWYEGVNEDMES